MELGRGGFFTGWRVFPEEILFNIPGKKGEKNAEHEGVVNDPDTGQGFGNKVERIDQIEKTQNTAHQGTDRHLPVTAGEEVAKHGRSRADQCGKVGQLGTGTKGVHVLR